MICDTGFAWVWVGVTGCTTCSSSNLYNYTYSSDFSLLDGTAESVEYGSGTVIGYKSADKFCIDDNNCFVPETFLAIVAEIGLSSLEADGIVGLAPSN